MDYAGWVQDFIFLFLMLIDGGSRFGCKMDIRFSGVATGKERLSIYLTEAVKNIVGVWKCLKFVLAGWGKVKIVWFHSWNLEQKLKLKILLVVISECGLWWLVLRRLGTKKISCWQMSWCVSCPCFQGAGVEEGAGLLESLLVCR